MRFVGVWFLDFDIYSNVMETKKTKIQSNNLYIPRFIKTLGTGKEQDYFIENLSMLLASGMGVIQSLEAIKKDIKSKKLRSIIEQIEIQIEGGSSLWRALNASYLFPPHVISLIRVGEESGRLSENLKVIEIQRQKDRIFKSKVRSAMLYPMIVLIVMLVVAFGSAWFVLPKLASAFSSLDIELPFTTRIIISAGNFLRDYGFITLPFFVLLLIFLLYFFFVFPKTKTLVEQFVFLHVPGVRKIIQEIELARFGYMMNNLVGAGLPIIESVHVLAEVSSFGPYKKLYSGLENSVEEGNSFQKSFSKQKRINLLIPTPVQQMIVTAEQSGKLSEIFLKIGETYEYKTEDTTRNISSTLEPVLLIAVSIGVFFVAIGIISPIYNLIGSISDGGQSQQQSEEINSVLPTTTPIIEFSPTISISPISSTGPTLQPTRNP